MIKRIELINFMSHRHTVIEPARGLTVLTGPNNCGKSAVITALQVLCHNDNSTYVMRHGEKTCSVSVETDDGHHITWSRTKKATKYVVDGKTYDRLRGSVPDAVYDVLRLPKVLLDQNHGEFDIHFGAQKEPVFLVNETGRAAAGFFAASSDASRLLEMQKRHGQQTRDAKRDMETFQQSQDDLQAQLDKLETIPKLKAQFELCQTAQRDLENEDRTIRDLVAMLNSIDEMQAKVGFLSRRAAALQSLSPPPTLRATAPLEAAIEGIESVRLDQVRLRRQSEALNLLVPPPSITPTAELHSQLGLIEVQRRRVNKAIAAGDILSEVPSPPALAPVEALRQLTDDAVTTLARIVELNLERDELQAASDSIELLLERRLETEPVCPTCARPWNKQDLLHCRHSTHEKK